MDEFRESRGGAMRMGALVALFAIVVWASYRHGAPAPLPDIALGWVFLLHLERAAAVLCVVGAVLLIGWRAIQGDLPVRLGQIEYETKTAATGADAVLTAHENRLQQLEKRLAITRGAGKPAPNPRGHDLY